MNAPGSPSSALQTTYFASPAALRVNSHLRHVGKPAPPRPRSPDTRSSFSTESGLLLAQHLAPAPDSRPRRCTRRSVAGRSDRNVRAPPWSAAERSRSRPAAARAGHRVGGASGDRRRRPLPRCSRTISAQSCRPQVFVEHVADDHDRAARTGTQTTHFANPGFAAQPLLRHAARPTLPARGAHPDAMQLAPMQMRIGDAHRPPGTGHAPHAPHHALPSTAAGWRGSRSYILPHRFWLRRFLWVAVRYFSRIPMSCPARTRSCTSSSTMMTGARPHAPKHRPTSSENIWSGVVSPTSTRNACAAPPARSCRRARNRPSPDTRESDGDRAVPS